MVAETGDDDVDEIGVNGTALIQHLQAIHPRHSDIGYHGIHMVVFEIFQACKAIVGHGHLIAFLFQLLLHSCSQVLFIIHHQDTVLQCPSPLRRSLLLNAEEGGSQLI
ncbi:MAG: hypothetical protein DDT24_00849 [Chloroflexi bacterium]|nr:hypothetical protein [Chloroflexota bacterium]